MPKPINLIKYDLDNLNHIILEQGISEKYDFINNSIAKSYSITEFAKMVFDYGLNSNIKTDATILKNLLQQVRNDYFLYSIELFKVTE